MAVTKTAVSSLQSRSGAITWTPQRHWRWHALDCRASSPRHWKRLCKRRRMRRRRARMSQRQGWGFEGQLSIGSWIQIKKARMTRTRTGLTRQKRPGRQRRRGARLPWPAAAHKLAATGLRTRAPTILSAKTARATTQTTHRSTSSTRHSSRSSRRFPSRRLSRSQRTMDTLSSVPHAQAQKRRVSAGMLTLLDPAQI